MTITNVHDYLMLSGGTVAFPSISSVKRNEPVRLLLVDDEPKLLGSLHALLSGLPYQLFMAASGREALEKLSSLHFDLILLDLHLPDMHGHDVMDFIAERNIDSNVIVLSGETRIEAAIGALKRGAYGYLRKPYAQEELLNTIENVLRKRQLQAENRCISWQLKCSEELYRNLVHSSPDIIYILNSEGRFVFVSERAHQLLGYRKDELIGKHYSYIIDDRDLERARHLFGMHGGRDSLGRAELTFKCLAGGKPSRIFDNTLMPMSLHPGEPGSNGQDRSGKEFSGIYGVARDITERKQIDKLISYQAYHDILTGLPNRALFKDRLELALAQAKRHGSKLALVFFDLDRFKEINDSLGHMAGDELLRQVSARLKARLRQSDTLARLGGDEFIAILPRLCQEQDARMLIDDLLESLNAPFVVDGHELHASASIGVAIYPSDGQTMDDLLRHADIAMYQAKAAGGNAMRFFDADVHMKLAIGALLEKAIRQGIEQPEASQQDQRPGNDQQDALAHRRSADEALHPIHALIQDAGERRSDALKRIADAAVSSMRLAMERSQEMKESGASDEQIVMEIYKAILAPAGSVADTPSQSEPEDSRAGKSTGNDRIRARPMRPASRPRQSVEPKLSLRCPMSASLVKCGLHRSACIRSGTSIPSPLAGEGEGEGAD